MVYVRGGVPHIGRSLFKQRKVTQSFKGGARKGVRGETDGWVAKGGGTILNEPASQGGRSVWIAETDCYDVGR